MNNMHIMRVQLLIKLIKHYVFKTILQMDLTLKIKHTLMT